METEVPDDSISTTWLLIYTAALLLVIHQLYTFTHFWRMGVPGPIPLPILGNYLSYAKAVGKDPPFLSGSLINMTGELWKIGRRYMSPAFNGSRMKQILPSINSRCDVLMEVLDKKYASEGSFDTKKVFTPYVLDCTCCAFGIDADCQRNPDDPFLKHGKNIFHYEKPLLLLRTLIPSLAPVLNYFKFLRDIPSDSLNFFADTIKKKLELKTESAGTEKEDFLQLMIEAAGIDSNGIKDEEDGEEQLIDEDRRGQVTNEMVKELEKKGRVPSTSLILIGQSMSFILAGFDLVPLTMSFMIYALATYPEVQKKLQEEIDEMIPEGKPVEYDTVGKMDYLRKVWCETMRKWPTELVCDRVCESDFSYQGLNIPVGQYLNINVWDIHHNAEYWPEPDKFDPERFSTENKQPRHPCAYMPFGAGPRTCVGMRWAILESKAALIRILHKYSVEKMPQTPDLDDISNWGRELSLYPEKGIHARLVLRE